VLLEELLARARSKIRRLAPAEAFTAAASGALIVDIRSEQARQAEGIVPGSIHIPRTVLEWRLAPGSEWRNPYVEPGRPVIVLCDHGESSSLAAATLVELGVDAADVAGGFEAWLAAGLPVAPAPAPAQVDDGVRPGMSPPAPAVSPE
jgi:rhodanese-related sulfurtransferase